MSVPLPPPPEKAPSSAALFRYQVVCQVRARVLAGHTFARAVRDVSALAHERLDGESCRVSRRTLYRWLVAYDRAGLGALEPTPRKRTATSEALPQAWVEFVRAE